MYCDVCILCTGDMCCSMLCCAVLCCAVLCSTVILVDSFGVFTGSLLLSLLKRSKTGHNMDCKIQ